MPRSLLEELLVKISGDVDSLRREMQQSESLVKQKTDSMTRSMENFQKGAVRAAKALAAPLLAAFSIRAVQSFGTEAIRQLDRIAKRAQTANVSGQTLQELRFAFGELAGVIDTEMDMALQRFNRRLGLAIDGGGAAKDTFGELGISMTEAGGRARQTEVVLEDALRALAAIEDGNLRAAKASELFGEEAGPKLAGALDGGIDALQSTREEITGLISDERLRDAELLNDAFGRIASTIGGTLKSAIVGVTADFAEFIGLIERTEADSLRREIEQIDKQIASLQVGSPTRLIDRREDLERQLRIAELRTPFAERQKMFAEQARRAAEEDRQRRIDALLVTAPDIRRRDMPLSYTLPTLEQVEELVVEVEKAADQVEDRWSTVGDSMGMALHDSVTNALLGLETDFDDWLKRLAVSAATSSLFRLLASFGGPVGSAFTFLGFGGSRAFGGPAMAGVPYLVNERTPRSEIFIPNSAGRIAPAQAGGPTINITNYTTLNAPNADRSTVGDIRALLDQRDRQLEARISQKLDRRLL